MTNPSLTTGLADLAPRARIREAALRLYAEHGTQATSIRMVAEEAGMSAGAVMHHFKSKDELAEAVQHAVVAKIREVVSGVGLDQPPPVAARARRQAFDQLIADNPFIAGYIRRVTLEGGEAGAALFTEAFELVRTEMQALVEANIARPLPDPEIGLVLYRAVNLAHIVFGPLVEQMLGLSLSDPVVLERFRDAAVDLLTRPLFNEAPAAPLLPAKVTGQRLAAAGHDRREPLLDLGDPVGVGERERPAVRDRVERDPGRLRWGDRVGIVLAAHARGDLAGQQQGHPDVGAGVGQFVVERLAQPEQRVLGRDVRADAGPGGHRGHRSSDEQLGRLAGLDQRWHERAGQVHRGHEVHAHHPVPVGRGQLPGAAERDDPRVGADELDGAGGEGGPGEAVDVGWLGDVGQHCRYRRA
jgi:AcrR family transcriptional regulator